MKEPCEFHPFFTLNFLLAKEALCYNTGVVVGAWLLDLLYRGQEKADDSSREQLQMKEIRMSEGNMSDKKQTTGKVRSSAVRRRRQSLRARRRRKVWMIRGILLLVALVGLFLAIWGISAAIREGRRLASAASAASGEGSQEENLVAMGADSVRHFSFPILLVDGQGAAEGSSPLTVEEFQQILQDLYDKDYILVDIYALASVSGQDSGSQVYEKATLSLPEGKTPFVLSQRDVSYPFDKAGKGYASRLVVDGDGRLVHEYVQGDGSSLTGDYDVVSCLETFIEEHPDFSWQGARGILGLTGYNGILGYRTTSYLASTEGNPYADYGTYDTQSEIAACQAVVQTLKDRGWRLASNGNGNTSYGSEMSQMQTDADLWQANVASVTGAADILIFPYETDIGGWSGYSQENEKYSYLWNQGFRYFCIENPENASWLQVGQDYVRQGIHQIDSYQDYQAAMDLEQ